MYMLMHYVDAELIGRAAHNIYAINLFKLISNEMENMCVCWFVDTNLMNTSNRQWKLQCESFPQAIN